MWEIFFLSVNRTRVVMFVDLIAVLPQGGRAAPQRLVVEYQFLMNRWPFKIMK
jgi:hypothetical protein